MGYKWLRTTALVFLLSINVALTVKLFFAESALLSKFTPIKCEKNDIFKQPVGEK